MVLTTLPLPAIVSFYSTLLPTLFFHDTKQQNFIFLHLIFRATLLQTTKVENTNQNTK